MPNHVKNRLTIIAEPERLQEILEQLKQDEHGLGSIDFDKILPMPLELNVECSSRSRKALEFYKLYAKHERDADPAFRDKIIKEYQADQAMMDFGKQLYENVQKHGAADWYDWSVTNWGTKWNSYGYDDAPRYEGGNEIAFNTAWSCPEPVVKRLSQMFPDIQFQHRWADEDIGQNVGEVLYQDGEVFEYDVPTAFTKEAYEMASDIWDTPLAEWDLYYGGNYEYWDEKKPSLMDTLKAGAAKSKSEFGTEDAPTKSAEVEL